jgi:hypothetical protein
MTGRKSLLYGVHQFIWHPITVWLAWYHLYGRPTFKESICIIIHDWGYWFTSNMDGPEGERHPEFGARIADKLLGKEYYNLVLLHSRHYARLIGQEPSKLCWADKLSVLYDPKPFYLFRARLSGEINEYRMIAEKWIPITATNGIWFDHLRKILITLAREKKADAVPYSRETAPVTYILNRRRIIDLSYRKERSQQRNR